MSNLDLFYLFQPNVKFHIETSHLHCSASQMSCFHMKYNNGLKWLKANVSIISNSVMWFAVEINGLFPYNWKNGEKQTNSKIGVELPRTFNPKFPQNFFHQFDFKILYFIIFLFYKILLFSCKIAEPHLPFGFHLTYLDISS